MKLLVTGANGQVGWELRRSLLPIGEVIALNRHDCDLSRPSELPRIVRALKPDVIVNAAAYTAVDKAEQEEPLATIVNGTAVGVLAEEARRANALLIHYSTDYVFDGTKASPYTEDDTANPINAYGRSKLAGEQAVARSAANYLILRTSWVYAARGHNFVRTVLRARTRARRAAHGDRSSWRADLGPRHCRFDRAHRSTGMPRAGTRRLLVGCVQYDRRGRDQLVCVCASHSGSGDVAARPAVEQAKSSTRSPARNFRRRQPGRRIPVWRWNDCAIGSALPCRTGSWRWHFACRRGSTKLS